MMRLVLSLSALVLTTAAVGAADDPIVIRKVFMQANAAAAGVSSAMMKGDLEYNPAVAKAAISSLYATSVALGHYFPEDSKEGETKAADAIWENKEGFAQAVAKFESDSKAAMDASGRQGPADLAAFQAAIGPVLSNCASCHENFRSQ